MVYYCIMKITKKISLYLIFSTIFSFFLFKLIKFFISFISQKKTEEIFDILNENGIAVTKAPRSICHNGSKLLHPVVHIHIYNKKGNILLQKRSLNKDIQPGKWDTAVGGHISSGESVENALIRECEEEIGIIPDLSLLQLIAEYIYESKIEREFVHSYIYKNEGPFINEKKEIDQLDFFTTKEIEALIKTNQTTENFKYEYEMYLKGKLNKKAD